MKEAGVPAATAAAVTSRFAIATVCIFYGNGNGNGSQPQRMLIDGQQSADSQNAAATYAQQQTHTGFDGVTHTV